MVNAAMRTAVCLGLAGFLVSASAQAYTLESREHRFSIELPSKPEQGERAIVIKGKELDGIGWNAVSPAGFWNVEFLKLSAPVPAGALRGFYDSVINVEGRCRRVLSQKDIRHNGLAGREALVRDTRYTQRHGCMFRPFTQRLRVFVVRDRYYWIGYQTSSDSAMEPEVTRIMDSFRVLN